jgi:hypothetical protein
VRADPPVVRAQSTVDQVEVAHAEQSPGELNGI